MSYSSTPPIVYSQSVNTIIHYPFLLRLHSHSLAMVGYRYHSMSQLTVVHLVVHIYMAVSFALGSAFPWKTPYFSSSNDSLPVCEACELMENPTVM
ncbi:predicted protein [Sclerotinia sclerotiorum 1980 UF-70]|uniref:Uncharacterized protein n=1 Tax=Sclerotinia sclerotiorum (strain ATCC 18683 / 1980 / Ss-1) TaxID=665079 RepID=A7EP33_SCLS1|nr:predicted protein [Sclerotinia sclerotiorum 1980 UF-70]EDO04599.1 predicted protein [Sclerotinia sclerotiorum 1980 UF-70]